MKNRAYYTPEGVQDYLPDMTLLKRSLEDKLKKLFSEAGFREIETAGLEYYDAYTSAGSFAGQEELFKVQDEHGRLLVLRFDGTIPAARLAASVYRETPRPLRFSYIGHMYRFGEQGGGRQKEFTQAGVELMGMSSPAADAEIIALAIRSARTAGLEDIQIAIGQVAFFRSLMKAWNLSGEDSQRLPALMDQRNEMAVSALLANYSLPAEDREIVRLLLGSDGGWELLQTLESLTSVPSALASLRNIAEAASCLDHWGLLKYCSLDLGLLRGMNYYTGLIFKGYTFELGFPLLSGGRYDNVVSAFGQDTAATGFSIGIDFCLQALRRQHKLRLQTDSRILLVIPEASRALAWQTAESLRGDGRAAEIFWLGSDTGIKQLQAYITSSGPSEVLWLHSSGKLGHLSPETGFAPPEMSGAMGRRSEGEFYEQ